VSVRILKEAFLLHFQEKSLVSRAKPFRNHENIGIVRNLASILIGYFV